MPSPSEIAKGLTKAQRALLMSLDAEDFRDWKARSRNVNTRNKLARLGLTEYSQLGGISLYFMRRLTPLGLAVRDILKEQDNA